MNLKTAIKNQKALLDNVVGDRKYFLETAIENRKDFLAPYRKSFQKAKKPKERAKIIAKLIELEPSHLSEPWIIKEVIAWLRDRNSFDYLEEIFIKAPKRGVRTEDQRRNAVRDFYVVNDIDKIIAEKNISVREACKLLALQGYEKEGQYYLLWDTTDENYDLEKAIRQVYNNAKKKPANLLENLYPPWPHYGRDIEADENGETTITFGRR